MLQSLSTWREEARRARQICEYSAAVDCDKREKNPPVADLVTLANRASLVTQAFSQCPDTQVVMSGYSQGAQVTHLAAADLPAATMEKVSAVVTFGDPGAPARPLALVFELRLTFS